MSSRPSLSALRLVGLAVLLGIGGLAGAAFAAGRRVPDEDFSGSRYGSDGSFEGDFGTHFDLGDSLDDHPYATAVQRDGKVIQVGFATDSATVGDRLQAAVVRYSSIFVPDASFSANGKDNYNYSGDISSRAVAIAPDDKIVVTGSSDSTSAATTSTVPTPSWCSPTARSSSRAAPDMPPATSISRLHACCRTARSIPPFPIW